MSCTPVEDFSQSLCRPPDGTYPGPGTPDEWWDQFNVNWGFTIYRTFYGSESDEQWRRLLQKITTGAEDEVAVLDGGSDRANAEIKVLNLFRMDPRSDANALDGKTMEDVRQLYLEGYGGELMNASSNAPRIFLLADERVLADPELGVLHIVAADYDPIAAIPRNFRMGPQRYFGWLTSTLRFQVSSLCIEN